MFCPAVPSKCSLTANRWLLLRAKLPSIHQLLHSLRTSLMREVKAELIEENHATAVLVNLLEVRTDLLLRHLHPANVEAELELFVVHAAVVVVLLIRSVVEDPEELIEVEQGA